MVRRILAGALALTAVMVAAPAEAQFLAADLVYLPAVAHTSGEGSSLWRSDVFITNAEREASVDVAVVYLATGQISNANRFYDRATWLGGREEDGWGNIDPALADIPPGGTVVLRDVVGSYWADEAGVANAGALVVFAWEAGTLEDDGTRVYRNVIVNSRVFTPSTFYLPDEENEGEFVEVEGTYGQTLPGVPWYNLADPSAFDDERSFAFQILAGAAQDDDFRYNVGILNASDPLTNIVVVAQAKRGNGEPFLDVNGNPIARQISLPPLAHVQYNQALLTLFDIASAPDDVIIEVGFVSWSSGSSNPVVGLTTYGTLIDNRTNDPTAILPAFAYPYDVECQWPPAAEGEVKAGGATVQQRPLEIPAR
jgi:hypothetical protein